MNHLEAENKISTISEKISKLKIGPKGRRSPIPSELYQEIIPLLEYCSQRELANKLGIDPSLISQAKMRVKIPKQTTKKHGITSGPQFIRVEQKHDNISLAKGKVILEVTTNSGVRVTLFD